MAKSDSNSNDLRQDQPEYAIPERSSGFGGECSHTHTNGSRSVTGSCNRSGVTELSRLTSDSILTADRRGGILISFGLIGRPRRVLNPFGPSPRRRSELNAPPITRLLRFNPSRPDYIRASDPSRPGTALRDRHRVSSHTALHYLRASYSNGRRSAVVAFGSEWSRAYNGDGSSVT